jgi:hypothetical protein
MFPPRPVSEASEREMETEAQKGLRKKVFHAPCDVHSESPKNEGTSEKPKIFFEVFFLHGSEEGKGKGRDDALSVNYHPVSFAGIIFCRMGQRDNRTEKTSRQ